MNFNELHLEIPVNMNCRIKGISTIHCYIVYFLQGAEMPSRQLAKMAVALQMCQLLYREGNPLQCLPITLVVSNVSVV